MAFQIPNIFYPIVTLTIAFAIATYSWQRSRTVAIITIGWAILTLFTAQIPYFQSPDNWSDGDVNGYYLFNALFIIPVVLLCFATWRSASFSKFMQDTPSWVLTATQIYRLSGASLLILYLNGSMPAEIGLPNGIMDIIVGITALPLAWAIHRGFSWSRNLAIIWNIFGLLDFIIAATVISLSFEGLIDIAPSPTRMGRYPLSLITLYQVAIAAFIHMYLLQRLLRNNR
ncbi:MAG: hypothetical protein AAFV98_19475 [Chloroflexota bacterium]